MDRAEHLLTITAEECSEVAGRISKALRFGLDEVQPGQPFANRMRIVHELLDLRAMLEMLERERILAMPFEGSITSEEHIASKIAKVERFLLLSREQGTLTDAPSAVPASSDPSSGEAIVDAVLLGIYYDGCSMTRDSEPDEAAWLVKSRRDYPEHVDDARAVVRRLRAIGRPADGVR